jgi:hypothetical protein
LFAQIGIPHDFLEFLVEKLDGLVPIDARRDLREAQLEEGAQVALERFLPSAIVILAGMGDTTMWKGKAEIGKVESRNPFQISAFHIPAFSSFPILFAERNRCS